MADSPFYGPRSGVADVVRSGDALEFSLDVGRGFSRASNYALAELLPELPSLSLAVAWTIEGSGDDLPEGLLGCFAVDGADFASAVAAEEWLGTDG